MYDVIVVSIFYNRSKMVKKSVESVLDQIKNDKVLFIAVDDDSTDSTKDELEKFNNRDGFLFISQKNKGLVRSMIDVINSYQSKYIAIHGSGDISFFGRFNEQKEFLDNHSDVVCVGCKVKNTYPDGTCTILGGEFNKKYDHIISKKNPYTHGEVMIRRSAYEKVGGYDPFFKYAQDRDLWCRLSRIGNFASLENILYERYSNLPGSVSGELNKTLLQRYLSSYAVFRHDQFLKNKLPVFSTEHDILLFNNSKVMSDIERLFYSRLARREYNDAEFLLNHYCSENKNRVKPMLLKIMYFIFKLFKIKLR